MNAEMVLFALLQAVICGKPVDSNIKTVCTPEMLDAVYTLASRHDLAHLVGQAVSKLGLPESQALTQCKQAAMRAFTRYVRLNHAYEQVCGQLETAGIPFIPLKGSVLRNYYPEAWLRTSCDIDILVHESDLGKAAALLEDKLQYTPGRKSSHDLSLRSAEGVHLELHYSTIEGYVSKASEQILAGIWDNAAPVAGKVYHLQIPDSLFYYYHVAHMAKHFVGGGCGIRPFLDIWILNHKIPHDRQKREALLTKGSLLPFALAAEQLCEIWFSGADHDALSRQMEQFILSGGTYGTLENRVSMNRAKKGGKFRYALSRVFLPYDIIKYHYPVLQRHKYLLPVFQVVRWFKLLFKGGVTRSVRELQVNANGSGADKAAANTLLEQLGLL